MLNLNKGWGNKESTTPGYFVWTSQIIVALGNGVARTPHAIGGREMAKNKFVITRWRYLL